MALHVALMNGHLDVVQLLLAAGANTEAVTKVQKVSFVIRFVSIACGRLEWIDIAAFGCYERSSRCGAGALSSWRQYRSC
jgi:hypothetical protein